jgi:hypothetical protein
VSVMFITAAQLTLAPLRELAAEWIG